MKNARSLRKALAWIALAAVLLTGCTKASQADITAKSNTERLEDAAVVTLAYTPASQPAQEEVAATPVETVGSTGLRYDEVAVPTSPLYDLLGASTRYSVDLTPKSDIVKIIVDADVSWNPGTSPRRRSRSSSTPCAGTQSCTRLRSR